MSQEKAAEIIDLNASRAAAEAGGKETAGEFLAAARRAAGLDLAAVSDAIKVKTGHLEAIEASDAARLPATPYAVGFVKVYAGFLGLDADAVAAQFKTDIGADAAPPAERVRREAAAQPADFGGARLASLFGVVAVVAFMIWAAFQIAGGERQPRAADDGPARPDVVLKDETVLTPQPRPTADRAAGPPVVAVTEGGTAAATRGSAGDAGEAPAEAVIETAAGGDHPSAGDENAAEAAPAPGVEALDADAQAAPPPTIAPREEPPAPVVVEARLTRSIAPRYPDVCDAGAADLERVTVIFDITAEGRAANARVVASTNVCFNESALSALRRWRFDPRTVDGAPRPDLGKQATLNFRK